MSLYPSVGQMSLMGETSEGIRLHKLEVYNWGTFDKDIWTFCPEGETTLLTGDSGSGKSTLVDALATLLVSPRKIAYNKAADATARERTVLSYVRGYYARKSAYEGKGTPEALRDYRQYSVLLATFTDPIADHKVTLAAFFWFREQKGNPLRFYAAAKRELFIEKDFADFNGDVKRLRAMLKKNSIEVFDEFNHYSEHARKLLGGLSLQAIDLFQQTISMKKVEALTDFVRDHMLENTEIEESIQKLLKHYHSLNSAHEAVLRARIQTELLEPICANGRKYTEQQHESEQLDSGKTALDCWFASLKAELYENRIAQLTEEAEKANAAVNREKQVLDNLDGEIRRLDREILQHGGGTREALIDQLKRLKETLERRKKEYTRYTEYAGILALDHPKTEAIFNQNAQKAKALSLQLPHQKGKADTKRTNVLTELEIAKSEKRKIDEEIESLKGRTSNIPKDLITLRQNMCNALSMDEARLPFVGELIEVMESELEWEGAIERLLHGFARSILVSEQDYPAVSKWVNDRFLKGRLVYYSAKARPGGFQPAPVNTVADKLSVKPQTAFTQWLNRELSERFSHVCCRDLTAFRRENRAITLTGQIKSKTRHEKDDRRLISDRSQYVLGFSNRKKVKTLQAQSAELAEKIDVLESESTSAQNLRDALVKKENSVSELLRFSEFSDIDVTDAEYQCTACEERIKALKESDALTVLRRQRTETEAIKSEQSDKLDAAKEYAFKVKNELDSTRGKEWQNNLVREQESHLERQHYPFLEKNRQRWMGTEPFSLEDGERQEKLYRNCLQKESENLQKNISDLKNRIERGIIVFRGRFPSETRDTDDTVESLPDYHRMYNQLIKDDLPRYEQNFKNRLNSEVMHQIALFQSELDQEARKVKTRIESINQSMYEIDFSPGRYIKLNCEDSYDSEIRNFRTQLKACTDGALNQSFDWENTEERFRQIKEIIRRFQGREKESEADKRWTKKVTDVRNWYVFSATERIRETDEEYEHYTDSGGKSGGQKEKLAYTILAASLVYNYGLHEMYLDQSSFRLVVIDEAFLKSSDDSATYGLNLFTKLRFQLLIVTPLQKISTIEPFIAHVGFVSYNDISHQSKLMNVPIDVYKEKRKAWEDSHHA